MAISAYFILFQVTTEKYYKTFPKHNGTAFILGFLLRISTQLTNLFFDKVFSLSSQCNIV